MSDLPGTNTLPLHTNRAGEHLLTAETLLSSSPEWSKVVSFYSAYHSMKAALLADPVFGDVGALSRAHTSLTPESQRVTHHQGNATKSRPFGLVEIVRYLYRPFYGRYQLLHGVSLAVRYGDGTTLSSAEDCLRAASEIHSALKAGTLKHNPVA